MDPEETRSRHHEREEGGRNVYDFQCIQPHCYYHPWIQTGSPQGRPTSGDTTPERKDERDEPPVGSRGPLRLPVTVPVPET